MLQHVSRMSTNFLVSSGDITVDDTGQYYPYLEGDVIRLGSSSKCVQSRDSLITNIKILSSTSSVFLIVNPVHVKSIGKMIIWKTRVTITPCSLHCIPSRRHDRCVLWLTGCRLLDESDKVVVGPHCVASQMAPHSNQCRKSALPCHLVVNTELVVEVLRPTYLYTCYL